MAVPFVWCGNGDRDGALGLLLATTANATFRELSGQSHCGVGVYAPDYNAGRCCNLVIAFSEGVRRGVLSSGEGEYWMASCLEDPPPSCWRVTTQMKCYN